MGFLPMDKCSICCEDVYNENNAKLECGHIMHTDCVKKLRNSTCPYCRKEIRSPLISQEDIYNMKKKYMEDNDTINFREYITEGADDTDETDYFDEIEEDGNEIFNLFAISIAEYIGYLSGATHMSPEEIFDIMMK